MRTAEQIKFEHNKAAHLRESKYNDDKNTKIFNSILKKVVKR